MVRETRDLIDTIYGAEISDKSKDSSKIWYFGFELLRVTSFDEFFDLFEISVP